MLLQGFPHEPTSISWNVTKKGFVAVISWKIHLWLLESIAVPSPFAPPLNWLKPLNWPKLPSMNTRNFMELDCFGSVGKLTTVSFLKLADEGCEMLMLMFGFSRLWAGCFGVWNVFWGCIFKTLVSASHQQLNHIEFRPSTFPLLPAWRPGDGCVGME